MYACIYIHTYLGRYLHIQCLLTMKRIRVLINYFYKKGSSNLNQNSIRFLDVSTYVCTYVQFFLHFHHLFIANIAIHVSLENENQVYNLPAYGGLCDGSSPLPREQWSRTAMIHDAPELTVLFVQYTFLYNIYNMGHTYTEKRSC